MWRRGWDSNPRTLTGQRFSRPPLSTTQPPLRCAGIVLLPSRGHKTRRGGLLQGDGRPGLRGRTARGEGGIDSGLPAPRPPGAREACVKTAFLPFLSNPRTLTGQRFSRPPLSTTQPPLRCAGIVLLPSRGHKTRRGGLLQGDGRPGLRGRTARGEGGIDSGLPAPRPPGAREACVKTAFLPFLSNPRTLSGQRFSRPPLSTTQPPLRCAGIVLPGRSGARSVARSSDAVSGSHGGLLLSSALTDPEGTE